LKNLFLPVAEENLDLKVSNYLILKNLKLMLFFHENCFLSYQH